MYWASQEYLALNLFIARAGWALSTANYDLTVVGNEAGRYIIDPDLDDDGGAVVGVMAVVCVHEMITNGFRRLRYQDSVSFMRQPPGSSGGAKGHAQFFRMQSTADHVVMNLFPEGKAGETYRVTYIPHPFRLSLDTSPSAGYRNTVSFPMGWEERIVLGMARRGLIREESDPGLIDTEIKLWDTRIEESCWNRVLAEAPVVRNVDNETYGWSDRIIWPPYPNSWFWA
jgi:hypothetical protein